MYIENKIIEITLQVHLHLQQMIICLSDSLVKIWF